MANRTRSQNTDLIYLLSLTVQGGGGGGGEPNLFTHGGIGWCGLGAEPGGRGGGGWGGSNPRCLTGLMSLQYK